MDINQAVIYKIALGWFWVSRCDESVFVELLFRFARKVDVRVIAVDDVLKVLINAEERENPSGMLKWGNKLGPAERKQNEKGMSE